MSFFSFSEIRLIIAKSTTSNNISLSYLKEDGIKQKYFSQRISLIKTLKTYIKKYCQSSEKYNILYLSILYLDIILSKNKISLSHDKNLKYLCLCCFLLSLKFIGNYDLSKKIILNFCRNYKQEYRIFEIQCLMLLDHNLVYTTAYDFLNMILINEPKNLAFICNSLLYQICEESIYTLYSPFYISVAIFQIAKNSIDYNNHNHYDKYFHDERVKYLIKKIKYSINPPSLRVPSTKINKIAVDDNIKKNLNNTITNTNINIITNNNIHNNIVVINTICKKKSDNNFNKNSSFLINHNNMNLNFKEIMNKKSIDMTNNSNNYYDNNKNNTIQNMINKYKENKKITISTSKNNNNLCKNHFKIFRLKNSNNDNKNHKTIAVKDIKKRHNVKINSFLHSSHFLLNSNNKNNEQNSFELQKLRHINTAKEESISTETQTPNQCVNKYAGKKIFVNKSSLNFQLVSGVPKEKLVKLSRNLSKTMINANDQSPKNNKVNK